MQGNCLIKLTLEEFEEFLYSMDACINDVDVPIILKALLKRTGNKVPSRIYKQVIRSHERLDMGDY